MATKKSVIEQAINGTNPNKASKAPKVQATDAAGDFKTANAATKRKEQAAKDKATNEALRQSEDKVAHEKRLFDEKTGLAEQSRKDAVKSRLVDRKADKEKMPAPAPIVNINPVKDITKPAQKDKTAASVVGLTTVSYQTFAMTPTSGKMLWALTNAVLVINGQLSIGKRPWVPKGNIINFYSSGTILRHHIKSGNFEENDRGFVRLTVSGFNYFKARVNGMNKNQSLTAKDCQDVMDMLKGPAIRNKTRECKIIQSV